MSPGTIYRRSSSVSDMLHNLKWTNLSTRRSVNRLTMIYNILNGHSAITANNFFEFNKTQTRKKHNLTLRTYQPRGNIDKFQSGTHYQTLLFKPTRRSSSGSCSRNTYSKTRCLHWHSSNTHTQVHLRDRLQSPLKIIRRRRRRRRRRRTLNIALLAWLTCFDIAFLKRPL